MQQQIWLMLMPLVASFLLIAHGRTLQSNKDVMTSVSVEEDAIRRMDRSNLNLDNNIVTIRTPSSAVQEWRLVCQQLCGAALGGAACVPYCKNLPFLPFEVQLENATEIMVSKKDLICPELCGLQLGDDVCTCKNYITKNDPGAYKNVEQNTNVCAIFCDHIGVTLIGCAPCKRDTNNRNIILRNSQTLFEREVVPFGVQTSTTPNWKEICSSLCKTGDGGSLCNCDLSPFMI